MARFPLLDSMAFEESSILAICRAMPRAACVALSPFVGDESTREMRETLESAFLAGDVQPGEIVEAWESASGDY